ncbi:DNA polymerase I [Carboxylicivirga sediminis]|uniref:DNA polymerase I n=1 Tax=Carboxylicivirga sediminis TaxID=2006564 RepID=A0A941F6A3_9BACT|nr:DNA polymerase I [Carboxylicivirga sediminis]MBR8537292.1 DNA polymerase I [Carboxylicivirga sediminis]
MLEEKKDLYLLDAYALIFRAYYAFIRNPRINSKGMNTSAIFGFTNSLLEILTKENPSHIAVVFDPSGPTFRHEEYPEYKANRDATPEDIKLSVPYIKQFIEAMNIPVIVKDGYEADDVIGTLSNKASQAGYTTYMVTPDKDYAQLVKDNVIMYKPRSKGGGIDKWGVEEVKEKFEIDNPLQVIDILALWGDTADNIPGCPGVGEKRAKDLIKAYGSINGIYDHIDELKGKQKENMINFREQVELSYRLATIRLDVPVELDANALKKEKPNMQAINQLFDELEFKNLAGRINQLYGTTPVQGDLFGMAAPSVEEVVETSFGNRQTIKDVIHHYYLVDNEHKLASLRAELSTKKQFCFDTETTSVHAMEAELVGMSFAWKANEAYYVPVMINGKVDNDLIESFKSIFEDKKIIKIGQNLKYDMLILKNYSIDVKGPYFDTMVAHHLLYPGLKNGMDFMAETYLNYTPVAYEAVVGPKGKQQKNMRDMAPENVLDYAAEDADITWQLAMKFQEELKGSAVEKLFNDIEMPLIEVLANMEFVGVKLDAEALKDFAEKLREQIIDLEKTIEELAGMSFNIASPKQVGEVLFEHLKIDEKAKKTKSGQYSTNEETLQKLKDRHEIIPAILEYRGLVKLLNTYVEALPKLINEKTGKIHTSYSQATVVTGRLSSNNPNLQNIPIRDENGKEIRKAFTASDTEHVFLSADYSQVELRLMAHFSGDEHLIDAFNRGEDIHAATAAKIFKVPLEEVTADMRRKAKTANFGIIYGISAFGLAERLTISRKEAKEIIDGYFESFPGVKEFMDGSIAKARENNYVETLYGRKRNLSDINSRNGVVRGMAERNAINAPIQGTAADIIKQAMVNIQRRFETEKIASKMILQVHDELNFDVLKSEEEKVKAIVKEEMEQAIKLSVPFDVDMGVGVNWLEAH